jgi:hypothetical protein
MQFLFSPFFYDEAITAGLPAFTLLSRCVLLFDPYLPLQPVTVVTFGSPFGFLAESFREGSCLKSFVLIHLAMSGFQGTDIRLATHTFHRKLPATCVTICLTL